MTNVVKEQKSKVPSGKRTTISDVPAVKYRKENLRLNEFDGDDLPSTLQSVNSRNSLSYQFELIDQVEYNASPSLFLKQ